MSDRCEPPEHLRGVNGWHWLDSPGADDTGMPWPCRWVASAQGWWGWGLGGHAPQEAAEKGYRYLAPVTPPCTVAALVEALERIAEGDHPEGTSLAVNNNYRELESRLRAIARAALALYRGDVA